MAAEDREELSNDARPGAAGEPFTLVVDGETFSVTVYSDGRCDYSWESGPNSGYGVSSGPPRLAWLGDGPRPSPLLPFNVPADTSPPTIDAHRRSIRDFLAQVNPETGYIGD
ncbi:hypothetical protein [Nocardia asteroides]|uniref:hypothetical protein n=1 Tax=Nocardia asteroides TaxID=1824 RepID=UPI001E409255|nr:hypothetical protein [Nocardia asteroides]UGT59666.1 hypothetical protein LTT61_20785 [Nocardia asteroides]